MSTAAPSRWATARQRWRTHRSSVVIAVGLALGVAVVLVLRGPAGSTVPHDPDNAGPDGARALAQVLDDQGVEVDVVRSTDALDDARVDASTTVLVTSSDNLGASTAARLRERAAPALLVLTTPGRTVTDSFGYEPGGADSADSERPADCVGSELVGLLDGLALRSERAVGYPAPSGCFYGESGALVAQPEPGVVLLGAGDVLANSGVLEADNAAVALRLLGQRERLVWYVPDLADLAADDAVTLSSLLPDWLRPGLWTVGLALVALVLWRGRRLGPLVSEPLPVVVRAIETTRSRGRLYRRADDRTHAAETLRAAGRAAAAERLRLPAQSAPDALVRDVARHVGRPVGEIATLLHPGAPPPTTDQDLIALATALAELDREVRRT